MREQGDSDVRVIGLFDDRGDDRSPQCGNRPAKARHGRMTWSNSRGGAVSTS
jgi:hypothetical protein